MPVLTIPKKITNGRDLVVIPREEYERLLNLGKRKVKKISELDKELEKALKEVREGKVFGPFETAEQGIKFLKEGEVK